MNEPIPPALAALIAKESLSEVPQVVEARLLARLDASVDAAFAEAAALPLGAAAAKGSVGLLAKVGVASLVFSAGVGTGAILHARLAAPLPAVIVVAPTPARLEPVAVEATPRVETPPPIPIPHRVPAPKQPVVAHEETTLEAERRLLEPGRTALSRGKPDGALAIVTEHARRFPKGILAEERDGLWVQALALAGDRSGAQSKAKEFRDLYPDSLLLPVVEHAVSPAP